jgi:hypothetical protein
MQHLLLLMMAKETVQLWRQAYFTLREIEIKN